MGNRFIVRAAVACCFVTLVHGSSSAQAIDECQAKLASVAAGAYPQAEKASDAQVFIDGRTLFLPGSKLEAEADRYSAVCRVWPAHPQRLLVAAPLMADMSGSVVTGDLEILVANTSTLRIEHRLLMKDAIEDDAFKISSMRFDTARYRVKPTTLAFGLRVAKTGSSAVNPFEEVTLSLYAIEDDRLKQILDGIVVDEEQGEWDGNCDGTIQTTTRTLSMDAKVTHGLADIRVEEEVSVSRFTANERAECREQTDYQPARRVRLEFDGNRYVIPDEMKPL